MRPYRMAAAREQAGRLEAHRQGHRHDVVVAVIPCKCTTAAPMASTCLPRAVARRCRWLQEPQRFTSAAYPRAPPHRAAVHGVTPQVAGHPDVGHPLTARERGVYPAPVLRAGGGPHGVCKRVGRRRLWMLTALTPTGPYGWTGSYKGLVISAGEEGLVRNGSCGVRLHSPLSLAPGASRPNALLLAGSPHDFRILGPEERDYLGPSSSHPGAAEPEEQLHPPPLA